MSIFSKKVENIGRQEEVDLQRGMSALVVPICHVGLYLGAYAGVGIYVFSDIIGSEWAAPFFMALMGISLIYSRHQTSLEMLKHGISIFVLGYALNFYRSMLPFLIFGSFDEWASVEAFFVVDIMQFAGLAFMAFALFRKLKLPNWAIFAISIVMVIIDQFIMLPDSVPWDSEVLTGLVNLFCPVTSWSCFPFLTWFIFPAFGCCFGEMLTHCANKKKLYSILLPIGLAGVLFVYGQFYRLYPNYTSYYFGNNFYYMGLGNALLTLLFICFGLGFWYFAGKILPGFAKTFLSFLSKNINTFYIFSWILIIILVHMQMTFEWKFDALTIIVLMVASIVVCTLLTKAWLPVKRVIKAKTKNMNDKILGRK